MRTLVTTLMCLCACSCVGSNPQDSLSNYTNPTISKNLKIENFYSSGLTDTSYLFLLLGEHEQLRQLFKFEPESSKMQLTGLWTFIEKSGVFEDDSFKELEVLKFDKDNGDTYFLLIDSLKNADSGRFVFVVWTI